MKYLKVAIASFIFFYLIGAFYSTTFILPDWTEDTRHAIATLITMTTIFPWAGMAMQDFVEG